MKGIVGEICVREVVVGRPEESVLDIARRMREHHVGTVVLVREGERTPVAIVTDRDIVVEVVAPAVGDPAELAAGDLVTRPLVTIGEDATVAAALETMGRNGIRRLPVVGQAGELVGILAVDDLVGLFADRLTELAVLFTREERNERNKRP